MSGRISGSFLTLIFLLTTIYCSAQLAMPLADFKLTSKYGMRLHPVLKAYRFHTGIDLSANYEVVYSIFSGEITGSGEDKINGKYVIVSQGNLQSIYAHLSALLVRKGEWISAGDVLGVSGNSGRSTGPHLHLSIKISGKFVNPLAVIKALLALSIDNHMEQNIADTDKLSLSIMMLLLSEKGSISLSRKQAEEYGVSASDHLPIEEEGGEDGY